MQLQLLPTFPCSPLHRPFQGGISLPAMASAVPPTRLYYYAVEAGFGACKYQKGG